MEEQNNLTENWSKTIEGGKGFFRDPWKALFISCELWNGKFFPRETWFGYRAVNRESPNWRIAKWLFIFILKCDCKPWFSFSCKKIL